jgi:hypothetical protein
MQRDARIDAIRGAGILMIALDHFGSVAERLAPDGFVLPFVTWTRIGWSSAAEFFVFFSGYLIGLVYVRTLEARGPWMLQARALHRSWEIYAANLLTLCLTFAVLYGSVLGSPTLVDVAQMFNFVGVGAGAAWLGFLTLRTAPMFFEILQLYVVLLLVAPLVLLLARVSMLAAFAISFATWVAVQFNPEINLAAWHFNPFAWQFVFVLGMLCSVGNVFSRLENVFNRRSLLIATGAFVACSLVLKGIDKASVALPLIGPFTIVGIDKMTLGPVRLLHFLISVVFVVQLMPRSERANASLPMRSIARVGRHSLECFCASTLVVYACAGFIFNTARINTVSVLLGGVALVLTVCAFAIFMEWVRSEPWRGERAKQRATTQPDPNAKPIDVNAANPSTFRTFDARSGAT